MVTNSSRGGISGTTPWLGRALAAASNPSGGGRGNKAPRVRHESTVQGSIRRGPGVSPSASDVDRQSRIQQAVNTRSQFWNEGMVSNLMTSVPSQAGSQSALERYDWTMHSQYSLDDFDFDDDDDDDDVSAISSRVAPPRVSLTAARRGRGAGLAPLANVPYYEIMRHEVELEHRRLAYQFATAKNMAEAEVAKAKAEEKKTNESKSKNEKPEEPEVLPPTFRWVHIEIVDAEPPKKDVVPPKK